MYTVESRLPADNRYVCHGGRKTPGNARVHHSVLIRGTRGKSPVPSPVSADDYAWLKDDAAFQRHVANGSLIVRAPAASADAQQTEAEPAVETDVPLAGEKGERAKGTGKEPAKAGKKPK